MSALGVALRPSSWWRLWYATGWLRWHLPVSRETALRLAEEQADAYYQVLNRKHEALIKMLENVIADELHAEWDRAGCQPAAGYPPSRRHRLRLVKGGAQ